MKTNIFHIIFSVIMAFLVLFSTFSFTVEKHYCGGYLVDSAVFTKVKKCSDADVLPKPCCKDDVEVVKGQDHLKVNSFKDLDLNTQIVFTAFVCRVFQFQERLPKQIIPHKYYSPPKLVVDLQVLHVVYII